MFGIRKMEVETVLENNETTVSDADRESSLRKNNANTLLWVEKRRALLAELNQDNVVFESDSLRMRGNPDVKAGMYLDILRGPRQTGTGKVYAHTVTQEFAVYNGYFTTVHYDRGTGFITRAQRPQSMYLPRLKLKGLCKATVLNVKQTSRRSVGFFVAVFEGDGSSCSALNLFELTN